MSPFFVERQTAPEAAQNIWNLEPTVRPRWRNGITIGPNNRQQRIMPVCEWMLVPVTHISTKCRVLNSLPVPVPVDGCSCTAQIAPLFKGWNSERTSLTTPL